jgi:hypothetical protein
VTGPGLDLPPTRLSEVLPQVSSLASIADKYHVLDYHLQLVAFHSTRDLAQWLGHLPAYDPLEKSYERMSPAREAPTIKPGAREFGPDVHAFTRPCRPRPESLVVLMVPLPVSFPARLI